MSRRILPARPHIDHLRHEARALQKAFARGDADALARVRAVAPEAVSLRLTEAQRVVAREYGFPSWARLRAHVEAARGVDEAVDAFLRMVGGQNIEAAQDVLRAEPGMAAASLHVAAALGRVDDVRALLRDDPAQLSMRRGPLRAEPLLWLCYSPFHAGSRGGADDFAECLRAMLDAGADPNTRPGDGGPPALYALTGLHDSPRLARVLLEAGANPTDGESLHHAAERYHHECLELLLAYGADVNARGDWGNTPLFFLMRYFDIAAAPATERGVRWLLEHGADPNVRCGREQETALHAAVQRAQKPGIVQLLLEHGADVEARRADGRTAWRLAARGGVAEAAALLEAAGARSEPLDEADALLAACVRGDAVAAGRISTPTLIAALGDDDLRTLISAADRGSHDAVRACLAAGLPVDVRDEHGASALHHAAIRGAAAVVRELLHHGADHTLRDHEHDSPPLGWAFYGADYVAEPSGDYADTVRTLLEAGARPLAGHTVADATVRGVLRDFEVPGFD